MELQMSAMLQWLQCSCRWRSRGEPRRTTMLLSASRRRTIKSIIGVWWNGSSYSVCLGSPQSVSIPLRWRIQTRERPLPNTAEHGWPRKELSTTLTSNLSAHTTRLFIWRASTTVCTDTCTHIALSQSSTSTRYILHIQSSLRNAYEKQWFFCHLIAYSKSNGHVTDDVTCPCRSTSRLGYV